MPIIKGFDAWVPNNNFIEKTILPAHINLADAKAIAIENPFSLAHVIFPESNFSHAMQTNDIALFKKAAENLELQTQNGIYNRIHTQAILLQNHSTNQGWVYVVLSKDILPKKWIDVAQLFSSELLEREKLFADIVKHQCQIPVLLSNEKIKFEIENEYNSFNFNNERLTTSCINIDTASVLSMINNVETQIISNSIVLSNSAQNICLAITDSPKTLPPQGIVILKN